MSVAGLIAGQLLPWWIGVAWVSFLYRDPAPGRPAIVLGYGYLAGSFALTLWMRLLSALDIRFGWLSIALPLLLSTAIPLASRLYGPRALWRERFAARTTVMPRMAWAIVWLLGALIALHFLLAALEIVWRPLFPWDAWAQWATKSHVWYELQRIVPFLDKTSWFAGDGYTDAAPMYPGNVPLLQVWSCIALGRWDDSLMNLPW